MRMLRPVLFLLMVSAPGCVSLQPVHLQLPPDARIGILNVVESQMTHVDVGSLRFDSSINTYTVDWNLPGYLTTTIENDLRARGSYTFVPIAVNASSDWKQSMSGNILSAVKAWMPDELKSFMKQASEESRLDLIITVSSYNTAPSQQDVCFTIAKNAVVTRGYGLYTRTSALSGLSGLLPVGQNTATPYANIIVAIFQVHPVNLAVHGRAPCRKRPLQNFPWPADLQFLGPAQINPLKPYVEQLSREAVQAVLGNAGLLP
jgi:hypothetical protein